MATTAKLTRDEARELDRLATAADNALCALRDRIEELANDWEEAISERSERWQESLAGDEAQDRLDTLRALLDEYPENVSIELEDLK